MKTADEIMGLVVDYGTHCAMAISDAEHGDRTASRKHSTDGRIVFAEIRAALTGSMGWQGIDSAPKDGDPVLVYKSDERRVGAYMTAAYWGEWPDCEDCWIAVGGKPLGYFSKLAGAPQGYPSHWMPLPPPPAEGEK